MKAKSKKSHGRKVSSAPTRNYLLGVVGNRPFTYEQSRLVNQQLYFAHLYRAGRIEIEKERRAEVRAYERTLDPEIERIDASIDALGEEIDAEYEKLNGVGRRSCKRHPDADEKRAAMKTAVEAIRERRKPLYEERKARLKSVHERLLDPSQKIYVAIREAEVERIKAERGSLPGPNTQARQDINTRVKAATRRHPDVSDEWKARDDIDQKYEQQRRELVRKTHTGELFAESFKQENERAERQGYKAPKGHLYTGGYQGVDDSLKATFRDTANPEVPRYQGEGRLGVQVTKNKQGRDVTWGDILGGRYSRVKVTTRRCLEGSVIKTRRRASSQGGERREPVMISIKLAGRSKDDQCWLDVPVILHRDIPPDAAVKWIWVVAKRIGGALKYKLMLTLEHKSFSAAPTGTGTLSAVLGWSTKGSAVRVCTTYDGSKIDEFLIGRSSGEGARLVRFYRGWNTLINNLLSVSDECFDATKARFVEWLRENSIPTLKDVYGRDIDLRHVHAWKSHHKLRKAARAMVHRYCEDFDVESFWVAWKTDRGVVKSRGKSWSQTRRRKTDLFNWERGLGSDGKLDPTAHNDHMKQMFDWFRDYGVDDDKACMALYLEWWRRKDEHLVNWARREQRRMKLSIRERYRRKAAELASKYNRVVFLNWDKNQTAESPSMENDTRTQQQLSSASIRQLIGPAGFVTALKEAFGTHFQEIESDEAPVSCYKCGGSLRPTKNDEDDRSFLQCHSCKAVVEKDVNRAIGIWNIVVDFSAAAE